MPSCDRCLYKICRCLEGTPRPLMATYGRPMVSSPFWTAPAASPRTGHILFIVDGAGSLEPDSPMPQWRLPPITPMQPSPSEPLAAALEQQLEQTQVEIFAHTSACSSKRVRRQRGLRWQSWMPQKRLRVGGSSR